MVKQNDFKYIRGKYETGCPADICFYTDVDDWSVDDFLCEFNYLVDYVSPSKIRIHINSAGGSVVDGMSVFSKIMDCQIPTECINDALAASMGSIIWAAGDELYMKDYALLMIHNPFCDSCGDKEYNQATDAFAKQLKTIYMKRFGLSEEMAEDIMNGKEGEDGTFLTAEQAVEKGFVRQDHIIETPKAVKDRIQAAVRNSKDVAQIKAVYGLLDPSISPSDINNKHNNQKIKTMRENETTVFAALFGLEEGKATAENVIAKINELKAKADKVDGLQKDLDTAKAELQKANAELTGAQSSINNLTEDLKATKDALKVYQDAETQAKQDKVNALIQKAVGECKINKDEVEAYTKMAEDNFELAVNVLAKIPAREDIGAKVAEANKKEAAENAKSEEQKVFDKVKEVVGEDFKFRSME